MPVPYQPAPPPVPGYGANPFGRQQSYSQPGHPPHPGPTPGYAYPPTAARKEVGVAYLLWFFLGGFGAHHFYLGGIITSWVMIGFLALIALAIMILVDLFAIPSYTERANMTGGHGRRY
jgi:hypothetical protein